MTRILADLPEEDIRWLDARAAEQGKSRAAVLREAVVSYRAEQANDGIERFFGIWKDRGDIHAVRREERASSARAWNEDSRGFRGEFSDRFDYEDDRDPGRQTGFVASRPRASHP